MIGSAMASEIPDYVKKIIRDVYGDIPMLRPLLLNQTVRTLLARKLTKAIYTDALPIEVAVARISLDGMRVYRPEPVVPDPEPKAPSQRSRQSLTVSSDNQRGKLLKAYSNDEFSHAGLTDEEAFRVAGLSERSCWWKRAGELREAGLITPLRDGHDVVVHRKGSAGVDRMVCVITDDGIRAIKSMED